MAYDRLDLSDKFCLRPGLLFQENTLMSLCGNMSQGLGQGNRDFMPQFRASSGQFLNVGCCSWFETLGKYSKHGNF